MHKEEMIASEAGYQGRILTVHRDTVRLENGHTAQRDVVRHPGGVAVLAVDDQDRVLLVRQFRYPTGQALLELPAGKLEYGEDPRACGMRELAEETGCTAAAFTPLGTLYPSPAYTDERIYLYLATGLTMGQQHLDADEFVTVEHLPLPRVREMILSGEIEDAKTQIGVLKYDLLRGGTA